MVRVSHPEADQYHGAPAWLGARHRVLDAQLVLEHLGRLSQSALRLATDRCKELELRMRGPAWLQWPQLQQRKAASHVQM